MQSSPLGLEFRPDDSQVIAIMGATGTGKTSFVNKASGCNFRVGQSLESCTPGIQATPPFKLSDHSVTLVDTPGFDDSTRSDTDILKLIATFLAKTYESGKKLTGVIYIHRISDNRMGGIAMRNFRMFRQLCGDTTLKNVVIVTTMWAQIDPALGAARESELITSDKFFKPVLDKGAQIVRHEADTVASAHAVLKRKISRRLRRGEELNREFAAQIERHRQEIADLQEEMREAIRARDEETHKELEEEAARLHTDMARVQNESKKLAAEYGKQMGELQAHMKREAERANAEHKAQSRELEARLRNAGNAEKAELLSQLKELQRRKEMGFIGHLGLALSSLLSGKL
ncbi:GTP-binding protein A [Mycena kentingensis (nom. inval.)]|nr:GTP-binding protein A [Mycena kentingensis (nom. inval.)]